VSYEATPGVGALPPRRLGRLFATFDGHWAIQLRLAPARNGQRAALHFADEYRLGAVAQLAERRYGIPKAGGSNPPSSTLGAEASAQAREEVGAHEFRNHFGYYMERAAAGNEILIRAAASPMPARRAQIAALACR
jgi:hypothetical protein